MPSRRSVVHQFGASLAALAAGSVANAETYPTHRVKIITTVAPGGTVDVLARLIAQKLSESLRQNFHVEDIPGGGGKMGAAAAARSAPDGYTLLFVFNSFITDVSLYSDVPYDPIKDFAPVTLVATSPYVLVVPPSLGVHSVQELLSLVRANPGKYSYAAPGNLVDEMFRLSNGLDIVRVPFNSAPPAIASTIRRLYSNGVHVNRRSCPEHQCGETAGTGSDEPQSLGCAFGCTNIGRSGTARA